MSTVTQSHSQNLATYLPPEQLAQQKDSPTKTLASIALSEYKLTGKIDLMALLPEKCKIALSSSRDKMFETATMLFPGNQQDSREYALKQQPLSVPLKSEKGACENNEDPTPTKIITEQYFLIAKGYKDFTNTAAENSKSLNSYKTSCSGLAASLLKEKEIFNNPKLEEITTGTSYAELWARISLMIGNIKSNYVDFYADLMKKYTDMYEAFNSTVQKASSDAVSASEDANSVDFSKTTMLSGYNKFKEDVEKIDLGSVENWDKMSPEEKNSLVLTLEPAFKVNTDGKIEFNLDQYKESVSNTYPESSNGTVSTASYQAWLATFNSAGSALQSNMQAFSQRYTQANSTFDQLNKMLSGVINSLGDSAKDVLKSLS